MRLIGARYIGFGIERQVVPLRILKDQIFVDVDGEIHRLRAGQRGPAHFAAGLEPGKKSAGRNGPGVDLARCFDLRGGQTGRAVVALALDHFRIELAARADLR